MKFIAMMRTLEYTVETSETFTVRHSRRSSARACEKCGHEIVFPIPADQNGDQIDRLIKEHEKDENTGDRQA